MYPYQIRSGHIFLERELQINIKIANTNLLLRILTPGWRVPVSGATSFGSLEPYKNNLQLSLIELFEGLCKNIFLIGFPRNELLISRIDRLESFVGFKQGYFYIIFSLSPSFFPGIISQKVLAVEYCYEYNFRA